MAANTSPMFIAKGNFLPARINLALGGTVAVPTNLFLLITGGANGTRVDGVRFRNSQTTAAASSPMVHRIYFRTNSLSTTYFLIGEVYTANATRSQIVLGATSIFTFDQPLILKSGQQLLVGQTVYGSAADQFDAMAFAGDY